MPRGPQARKTARVVTLCTAVGVLALAVWSGATPSQLAWSSAYASSEPPATTQSAASAAALATQAATTSSVSYVLPKPAGTRCSPWDVSPVAMEAILREMVRRGWQPPGGSLALASSQPGKGLPIVALNPEQPVWVATSRGSSPFETGEIVDIKVEPLETLDVDAPSLPAITPPGGQLPTIDAPEAPESRPEPSTTTQPVSQPDESNHTAPAPDEPDEEDTPPPADPAESSDTP